MASLSTLRPTAGAPVTFYGHGGWTGDAKGPTDSSDLTVAVPSGSTVERAYLYGAYELYGVATTANQLSDAHRTVNFDGTSLVLPQIAYSNPAAAEFVTSRIEVTSQVAAKVGSGGSTVSFTATGAPPRPLTGITLVVVYSNPSSPEVSVAIMDGAASSGGDTATLNFASPLDKTTPGFRATMSLGIAWSVQGPGQGTAACDGSQASTVTVNTQELTACAGNSDDSTNGSEYVTFGGYGDSPTTRNGADGEDDELYDLAPYLSQGDTALTINTTNGSQNDHIFVAVFEVAALASAGGDGETPPPVSPPPTASPLTSTGAGTALQYATATAPSGGSVTLLDGSTEVTSLTVPSVGTYAIDAPNNRITFSPVLGYIGTPAAVSYRITNSVAQSADSTYTPTVTTPAAPAPSDRTTSGTGTADQTTTFSVPSGGLVRLLDGSTPVTSLAVAGQGTYVLDATTGVITFTPVFGYAGTATAVTVRVTDAYGGTGTAAYTPTVNAPAGPAPSDRTTSGTGTADQTTTFSVPPGGLVRLLDGSTPVTSLTIAGQGTYVLNTTTGLVTFTPVLGYAGTATAVTVRVTDAYSQSGTATYTPTVNTPEGPTATGRSTTGVGTALQTASIAPPSGGSVRFVGPGDVLVATLTVPNVGVFSVDPATGEATFAPVLGYVGTATVDVRVTDAYGHHDDAPWSATVTKPEAPVAEGIKATSPQIASAVETIAIPLGGSARLLDEQGNETDEVVLAEGTYRLNTATGAVTFSAAAGFAGTPRSIAYRVKDAYGQVSDGRITAAPIPAPAATSAPAATPTPAPAAATCERVRRLTLNWRSPVTLRRVEIQVDGRTVKRLRGTARRASVTLSANQPRLVKVTIVGRTAKGVRYVSPRDYRLCKPGNPLQIVKSLRLVREAR